MNLSYPWANSPDIPQNLQFPLWKWGFVVGLNGVDTVWKTEFAQFLSRQEWFQYFKVGKNLQSWLNIDTPASAVMWGFMWASLAKIKAWDKSNNIVMDPVDPIQVLSRLRGEGKLDTLSDTDITWLESQSSHLIQECLKEGYRIISLHLRAEDRITASRLAWRIDDPTKSTPYDAWLQADPNRQVRAVADIAWQIRDLERVFAWQKSVLFVQYDTSHAEGYPTNLDTKEFAHFLGYLAEYFGKSTLPSIVWTPYEWDSEILKWSNDNMHQEIILSSAPLSDEVEKRTSWTIPTFMKDGEWHVGFGIDIFDFSISSGELRLKPWWGQSHLGDLSARISQKFRDTTAGVISTNTKRLNPQQKIVTSVWNTGWTKELMPHFTELTAEQFADIRSTPRYCQILSFPIAEILQTVHKKEGSLEPYITHQGQEYRLAAGSLEMLLLFAHQKGILLLQ